MTPKAFEGYSHHLQHYTRWDLVNPSKVKTIYAINPNLLGNEGKDYQSTDSTLSLYMIHHSRIGALEDLYF